MEPVLVGEQCGMQIFRFSLPQEYWKSKAKLVLGREQDKGYEVNVDLSKLRWLVSAKHSNPQLTR